MFQNRLFFTKRCFKTDYLTLQNKLLNVTKQTTIYCKRFKIDYYICGKRTIYFLINIIYNIYSYSII